MTYSRTQLGPIVYGPGPSRVRDMHRKYDSGAEKRKGLQSSLQGGLLTILKNSVPGEEVTFKAQNPLVENDIGKWPTYISDSMRDYISGNPPIQFENIEFPPDENGRRFSTTFYNRHLPNGERIRRNCNASTSALVKSGFSDWKYLGSRLKDHEISSAHRTLRGVLKRIIPCIQFLAKHNDALRGSNCTLYTKNNGKFLGLVEMIAQLNGKTPKTNC
ncbi:hypothetical protein ILUMI_02553 [Ignelater luminosus]|uniref:Uncharacterized protein n=1 Tax=Ignelater luminosus TaxID=2038154 RepID=A0A8K0GL96_IGNLU|nr:hypothetical protein ILUMI_02553 [Ignelater luminosus]